MGNLLSKLFPAFRKKEMPLPRKRSGRNRRRHERIPIGTEVKVRMMGKEIAVADCRNISFKGMCLVFNGDPPDGNTGTVWLTRDYMDDYIKFEASFRKVWSRTEDPGSERIVVGILFQSLVPRQRDNLRNIIIHEKE